MDTRNEQGIQDLLRENVRISRDNNRLLRKLWRAQVYNFWSRLLFAAILIGVPVYIYRVYLDDYVVQVIDTYRELRNSVSGFEDSASGALRNVLE